MGSLNVENLGKCYLLEKKSESSEGLSVSDLLRGVRGWFRRADGSDRSREFWALKDVSFAVEPGTVLGIIGPNGAGKSTLLKILARVTPPTSGRARGSGRVVSLLELGAGFNPELSARENIIMNAAMHGISKADVLSRLDRILEFAEIERFLDQPLKHYSSGMYLRLAFSVAINMDPEILLADEILAVGDLAFQERCLQKVAEAGHQGLIVLFVSHDMDAIMRVCNRVIWLKAGEIVRDGDPEDVVGEYQESAFTNLEATRLEVGRQVNRFAAIRSVKLLSAAGKEIGAAPVSEDVFIKVDVEALKKVSIKGTIDVGSRNQLIFRSHEDEWHRLPEPGLYELRLRIPANFLNDINYTVTVNVTTLRDGQERQYTIVAYNALTFMAYATDDPNTPSKRKLHKTALLAPQFEWSLEESSHVART